MALPRAARSRLGEALTEIDDPPVKAIIVYNSNPLAIAPDSSKVAAGFAREDLFTVVLEHFQTDSADFADIVLPAAGFLDLARELLSRGETVRVLDRPGPRTADVGGIPPEGGIEARQYALIAGTIGPTPTARRASSIATCWNA